MYQARGKKINKNNAKRESRMGKTERSFRIMNLFTSICSFYILFGCQFEMSINSRRWMEYEYTCNTRIVWNGLGHNSVYAPMPRSMVSSHRRSDIVYWLSFFVEPCLTKIKFSFFFLFSSSSLFFLFFFFCSFAGGHLEDISEGWLRRRIYIFELSTWYKHINWSGTIW